jgi:hypothetical protein
MASGSLTRLLLDECLPPESSLSLEVSTLRGTTGQLEEGLNNNG